ncbi:MAG: hypothetical protein ACRCZF_19545, partial [Gemmataceae bacterium]
MKVHAINWIAMPKPILVMIICLFPSCHKPFDTFDKAYSVVVPIDIPEFGYEPEKDGTPVLRNLQLIYKRCHRKGWDEAIYRYHTKEPGIGLPDSEPSQDGDIPVGVRAKKDGFTQAIEYLFDKGMLKR